jgi:beta-lactam-binding protein with PASTA domain
MKHWLQFIFSRTFVKTIAAAIIVFTVAVFCSLWWLKTTTGHDQTVEVPNIKLMPVQQAIETLESLGLIYEVIDSTHYVTGIPKGAIIESYPKEYSKVKWGRKILLSTNPGRLPKYPLPNYKDQLVSYVSSKFATKGFIIDSLVMVPDLSHDLVLRVLDAKGLLAQEQALYPTGTHFVLQVSGGLDGRLVYLPDLTGLTYEDAVKQLTAFSLNSGAIIYTGTTTDSMGAAVLKTFPEYELDLQVGAGSAVDLWLASDSIAVSLKTNSAIDTLDEF